MLSSVRAHLSSARAHRSSARAHLSPASFWALVMASILADDRASIATINSIAFCISSLVICQLVLSLADEWSASIVAPASISRQLVAGNLRRSRFNDADDVTGFDQHGAWFDHTFVTDDARRAIEASCRSCCHVIEL